MSAKLDIVNMALSHLGSSLEVQDFDNEKSKEAMAARRFFDNVRDEILRDFVWPFAKTFELLAQVGAANPTVEWAYSYRYPAAALAVRRILNGSAIRVDTASSRVSFMIGRDSSGKLIYTDQSPATVEYTCRVTNTEEYPPDFVAAFCLLLAARMAPRITGGDPQKLGPQAFALYTLEIKKAKANAINEGERLDPQPDAEMIRVRGAGTSDSSDRGWP